MRKTILLMLVSLLSGVKGFLQLDWDTRNPAFNQNFYDDFLDPELCKDQLAFVRNNTALATQFIESGLRFPRGIVEGNLIDFGNYFQCLGINENFGDTNVEGKYCSINVPINQGLQLPDLPSLPDWFPDFDLNKLKIDENTLDDLKSYYDVTGALKGDINSRQRSLPNITLTLAVCVPKACSTQDWIDGLIFNFSEVGFEYSDNFCRTDGDKPWVPADYVALIIFSAIGLITIMSTSYDIWHTFIVKSDLKKINPLRRSFSLYTNSRRLSTFTKTPNALECLDGIRAISMMWIILGHSFATLPEISNLLESFRWTLSIESTYVTAAPISVDTFFMLSGLLLVYTAANKFTGMKLLKNLHVFYLNRLLRMFPLLAAVLLMQASFLYRLADGPMFQAPAVETDRCRKYWWTTLLYIQNYANPLEMCLGHTWYLAVDMHMHILSPIILFWVVDGRKRTTAWMALTGGLLTFLVSSTIFNFIYEFPGSVTTATRTDYENQLYLTHYYLNTLTRASPFFVGMLFGYLLHLWRGKKIKLEKVTVALIWIIALLFLGLGVFSGHPMKSFDWDNQVVDSLVNSFSRPIWAIGVGLIIVACVHGYGGPLDWFFSLQFWKLPSRLSYGMYLFHYQIMFVTASTAVAPIYFAPLKVMYRFVSELTIAVVVSFIMTVFIDSPFSTIFKLVLGGGPRKPQNQDTKINGTDLNNTIAPNDKTII